MNQITGKNKDGFPTNGKIKFTFSDRLSVFDKVVGTIPGRGHILAECTRLIFEYLSRNYVATAMIKDESKENIVYQEKCRPLHFEFIMRNLLTGSALKRVKAGKLSLPRGMDTDEFSKFPQTFIEISTKRETKDRYDLEHSEIIEIMQESVPSITKDQAQNIYNKALEMTRKISSLLTKLFEAANLFLVDGKVELGLNKNGQLVVIDSFGPDEFRAIDLSWIQGDRKSLPDFYDKEFIRNHLKHASESEYDQILKEFGPELIQKYQTVTNRLKKASEQF